MKTFENFINENGITLYTDVSEDKWETIWKDKNN